MFAHLLSGDFEKAKLAKETSEYYATKTINSNAPARSRAFARLSMARADVTMLESEGRWREAEPGRDTIIEEASNVYRLAGGAAEPLKFPPLMGPSAQQDQNKNNLIEATEVKGGPLHSNFKVIDCDKSGALDMHEIRGFFTGTGCPRKRNPKAYNLEKIYTSFLKSHY